MQQVIFLSFYCEIYKKNPIARIYIGDTLIDEIEIPEYVDQTFEEKKLKKYDYRLDNYYFNIKPSHILDPIFHKNKNLNPDHNLFKDLCNILEKITHPKIFIYFIDDEILKLANGSIRIIIYNKDSNYTNGFMSKSTLFSLHGFYIIPEIIIKNPIEITERYRNIWSKRVTAKHSLKKIKNFYKQREIFPINLARHFNLKNTKETKRAEDSFFIVGGDCELNVSLKKKNCIWWQNKKRIGFFHCNYTFIKHLIVNGLNKYQQHAN